MIRGRRRLVRGRRINYRVLFHLTARRKPPSMEVRRFVRLLLQHARKRI